MCPKGGHGVSASENISLDVDVAKEKHGRYCNEISAPMHYYALTRTSVSDGRGLSVPYQSRNMDKRTLWRILSCALGHTRMRRRDFR